MFLEIIANDEALFEVRVQIILDFFCAPVELPMSLLRIWLKIQKAHRVRDSLPDSVNIFQFAALDEELHFVPKGLFCEWLRLLIFVRLYH